MRRSLPTDRRRLAIILLPLKADVPTSTNVCRSVLVAMEWLKDSMLLKITTTVGILLLCYPTAQSQAEIGEHSINCISLVIETDVIPW